LPANMQKALEWALENAPPPVVVLIVAAILVVVIFWLSYRINRLINTALSQEQAQTADIAAGKKQQRKLEQLVEKMPCISKGNATWLQDSTRNGGQPPEPVECEYSRAKKLGG
jgi:hypothetical protein